jgi:hypothetical protein
MTTISGSIGPKRRTPQAWSYHACGFVTGYNELSFPRSP